MNDFAGTEEARTIYRDKVTFYEKEKVYAAYDDMGAESYEAAMLSAGYPDPW